MKATDLVILGGALVAVAGAIYLLKKKGTAADASNPDPTKNAPYAIPYFGSINN